MEIRLNLDEHKNYRLLQLTPKLQKSLTEGKLSIRSSSGNSVYICTEDSTHAVRKLKQSNTLLLMRPAGNGMEAFASPNESLETIVTEGLVDWSTFPEYRNAQSLLSEPQKQLWDCSDAEFTQQAREYPAVSIGPNIYKIPADVVHEVLVYTISAMVELGDTSLTSDPTSLEGLDAKFPPEVINACHLKFKKAHEDGMDIDSLSKWIGLYILQQHPDGMDEIRLKKEWILDLPVKLNTSLELLQGHVVNSKHGLLQYIDIERLPADIHGRLDALFQFKQEWPFSEIEPFLLPLMPVGQRLENWILKFARKRRVGSHSIICPLRR